MADKMGKNKESVASTSTVDESAVDEVTTGTSTMQVKENKKSWVPVKFASHVTRCQADGRVITDHRNWLYLQPTKISKQNEDALWYIRNARKDKNPGAIDPKNVNSVKQCEEFGVVWFTVSLYKTGRLRYSCHPVGKDIEKDKKYHRVNVPFSRLLLVWGSNPVELHDNQVNLYLLSSSKRLNKIAPQPHQTPSNQDQPKKEYLTHKLLVLLKGSAFDKQMTAWLLAHSGEEDKWGKGPLNKCTNPYFQWNGKTWQTPESPNPDSELNTYVELAFPGPVFINYAGCDWDTCINM